MKKTLATLLLAACLLSGCSSPAPQGATPINPDIPGLPFPLPSTVSRDEFQPRLYQFLTDLTYRSLPGWRKDKGVRDTGPFLNGVYYGTHPAVRTYYSPEVFAWMKAGRVGKIPDGAMIIKEMYNPPAARYAGLNPDTSLPMPTWTCMIKDSAGSKDGWYWVYFDSNPNGTTPPTPQPVDSDAPPFSYPNSGFGSYCVQCHTSADGEEFTFAALENVAGEPGTPITYEDDGSWRQMKDYQFKFSSGRQFSDDRSGRQFMARVHTPLNGSVDSPADPDYVNEEFVAQFNTFGDAANGPIQPIPGVTTDRSVAQAHRQFVSSDQCMSCHAGDSSPFGPNMFFPNEGKDGVDVSPFAEWSWSMMGLAGRDPIFHAQLETEVATHPAQGQLTPESIQDLCFSCHGVMGQRQLKLDDPHANFTQSQSLDPDDPYGKLARDGVSCALCHQIEDNRHVPLVDVQTGRFNLNPRNGQGQLVLNGPFEEPRTMPMGKSLNAEPVHNGFISTSRMCASCHTVFLPVLDAQNNVVKSRYEQSTYLEWLNSSFRDDGPAPRSCQECHMPDTAFGQMLNNFKIANIQDQDYPVTSNLSPLNLITMVKRPGYRRHVLLGINQFGLEFFQHFPALLGISKVNFMSGTSDGLTRAIHNSQELARSQTAQVELSGAQRAGNLLSAQVRVTNLTGHRFPSGVGFRRAFLLFEVRDGAGQVVWASGRTNSVGVIVGPDGQALPSEFNEIDPATGKQSFQPHHQVITQEGQVQVFEEIVADLQGTFSTSFLNRATTVKDNRLMPLGWTFSGPPGFAPAFAEATSPVGGAANDADFTDGTGSDTLTYQATLPAGAVGPFSVRAELFYQAIPPRYLMDRFTESQGPASLRLYSIGSRLDTRRTNFPNWKLPIAEATAQVP